MVEKLLEIARSALANTDKKVVGLPEPQVVVLVSDSNNFYVAINDVDGLICKDLKSKNDTKVVGMLAMWGSGHVDLPSLKFRKALIELDQYNYNTDIILNGKDGYLIKKLLITIP